MTTPITSLTQLAEFAYDAARSLDHAGAALASAFEPNDSISARMQQVFIPTIYGSSQLKTAVKVLSEEPDLAAFLPIEDQLDPMVFHMTSGSREPFHLMVGSLLLSAAQRMFYQRLDETQGAFVRTVLENYEDMLRAGRGEPVRIYYFVGYSGVMIDSDTQIQTPWGTIRSAPDRLQLPPDFSLTGIILSSPRLSTLTISRDPSPSPPEPDKAWTSYVEKTRQTLPLAFSLATIGSKRCAPTVSFEKAVGPFTPSNGSSKPGLPSLFPLSKIARLLADEAVSVEDWARRLDRTGDDNLQVAGRRLMSAISERIDKSDALIDAVVAWESIVGTRTETVYRVTAALARLLEAQQDKRSELRKELSKIYDIRSRVVHGDDVGRTEIALASDRAIEIALQTLEAIYARGGEWLLMKSSERSDRIILGD